MAKYRAVQVEFWQDEFTLTLTPEDKFFYLYLMTNTKSNQLGCYKIAKKMMEFETGYNRETIEKLLERFQNYKKIKYNDDTQELFILNWWKYNWSKSPKVQTCIFREFQEVEYEDYKDELITLFIEYGYCIDTLYIDLGEKVKSKKKKVKSKKNNIYSSSDAELSIPFSEIISYLNQKTGKAYRASTNKNKELIKARWNEGFRLDDFKKAIDNKVINWKGTEWEQYLRPSTLFGTKFEGYLNEEHKGQGNASFTVPEFSIDDIGI